MRPDACADGARMRFKNRGCEIRVDRHSGGAATSDAVGNKVRAREHFWKPPSCTASARCGARVETEYAGDQELDAPCDFSCVR